MDHIPTIDLRKTGQNIERLRKESGLSVRQLQEILGFSAPQAIYKWQCGLSLPTVDNLIILSSVFQVSIDEILVCEENKE